MTDGEYRDRPPAAHRPQIGYSASDRSPSGYPAIDRQPQAGYAAAGRTPTGYPPSGGYPPAGYQAGRYPAEAIGHPVEAVEHPAEPGYPAGPDYPAPAGYPMPGGHPMPGGYPPPAGLVPPPRPRRWPLWVGLGTVLVLLLCAAPITIGVVVLDRASGPTGPAGGVGAAASPKAGDPPSVTGDWLTEQIRGLLDGQAKALLGGDEKGYVGLAEPNTPIARQLRRDFRTLRAMRVSKWEPKLLGRVSELNTAGEWRANLTLSHCFVSPTCEPNEITMVTRWKDTAGQPRLIAIDTDEVGGPGRPRPWESDELVASIGERTLVAAPRAFRDRLPDLLREGERAARVADRYAVDGSPPERYLIFYAGPNEWSRWYGGNRPDWTAGYAVPVGGDQYDLVLNSKAVVPGQYADLMRHELTHASSLAGAERIPDDAWWLVEGIAEQAAAGGRAVNRYASLDDVNRLVNSGWNGELADVAPSDGSEDWHVAGSYGVGYLAVRHLVDRFGEKDVLNFFKLVVHDGRSEEEASQEAFGRDWSTLHDECVAYVKKTAS